MSQEPEDAGGARSVDRALHLLQEVATSTSGMTLSEAARTASLPTSTAARLLRTLEQTGFLQRSASGVYTAGPKVLQIGAVALSQLALYDLAEPHLTALSEYTGETAYLAVPDGRGHAVYLRQVESSRAIRHASWTGQRIATEGTALGAALAGRQDERGFFTSRADPVEPEACAAAAPVRDRTGDIVAAISIIGPSYRIDDDDLQRFGNLVSDEARSLTAELAIIQPARGAHSR